MNPHATTSRILSGIFADIITGVVILAMFSCSPVIAYKVSQEDREYYSLFDSYCRIIENEHTEKDQDSARIVVREYYNTHRGNVNKRLHVLIEDDLKNLKYEL